MYKRLLEIMYQRSRQLSNALIIIVFLIGLFIVSTTGNQLRYPDEIDYHTLAKNILEGKGFVNNKLKPTAFRPPGYPFFLSFVYQLWPHPISAKLVNAATYAILAWMLTIMAAKIIPAGRVFAPLLVLLYPLGFYTASTLYPQTLGALLLVTVLLLLSNPQSNAISICTAGVLIGILILLSPSFLLITPLIAGVVVFYKRDKIKTAIIYPALLLFCAIIVVLPWTFRNAFVFGKLVPVSTNSGLNLLLGNSENTHPNSGVNVDISHYMNYVDGLNEAEKDSQLMNFAKDWIVKNPRNATKLYFQKVLNYFNYRNELYVQSEGGLLRNLIVLLTYYPLLLTSIVRFMALNHYRFSITEATLYLIYFGNAFLSAIFFTRIRFRIPFDTLLIVINAAFLGFILQTLYTRNITKSKKVATLDASTNHTLSKMSH